MFKKFQRHAREGMGKFQVIHDCECATMRVLEGSTVLVNVDNLSVKNRLSPTASSPSSHHSGSSGDAHKNAPSNPGEHNGSGSLGSSSHSARAEPEYHMVDMNGIYDTGFTPSGINQLTPSMLYDNLNGIEPEPSALVGSSSHPMQYAQHSPSGSQSVSSNSSAGVEQTQTYGYDQSLNNYGALSMQDNVMPPYGAPGMQYEAIPGQAELYALQTGGFGTGISIDNMSDQRQWEKMLTNVGPSTSHVRARVNGGPNGSYHNPMSTLA